MITDLCAPDEPVAPDPLEDVQSRYFGIRRLELVPLLEGRQAKGDAPSSSVTLVRTPTSVVVVDSGSASFRDPIKRALLERGIRTERVNVLVSTRLDPVFSGNDELFPHALQHLKEGELLKASFKAGRKVEISTKVHWIDKYLMLGRMDPSLGNGLALFVHFPKPLDLLAPSSRHLAGKIVGIMGAAVRSAESVEVEMALGDIKEIGRPKPGQPDNIADLVGLLSYCDIVVPAYGPMFPVR
ncbi:MAG: hypothetical protein MUC62_05650 [Candidatus Thermoplasmatota archaeon]|jgi:hypothetical protein|nr:hypothetical protein [Candidatus Thermoplasmatota archaeon]